MDTIASLLQSTLTGVFNMTTVRVSAALTASPTATATVQSELGPGPADRAVRHCPPAVPEVVRLVHVVRVKKEDHLPARGQARGGEARGSKERGRNGGAQDSTDESTAGDAGRDRWDMAAH